MIEEIRICITQAFIKIFGKNTRISDRQYNQILYRLRTGKKANLDCPKTFNEHILARKVFMNEDNLTQYTDKYEVRFYVEKTIGSQFLVKNFGVFQGSSKTIIYVINDNLMDIINNNKELFLGFKKISTPFLEFCIKYNEFIF